MLQFLMRRAAFLATSAILPALRAADPCTMLPPAAVRQLFDVPSNSPLTPMRADSCSYVWMGALPGADQLRAALIEGRPRPTRASESVSLRVETVGNAGKELEARFEKLRAGYTVEREGQTLPVKPQQLEWVSGVGEKAFWNATLSQLVFAQRNTLVSLYIRKPGLKPAELQAVAVTAGQFVARQH